MTTITPRSLFLMLCAAVLPGLAQNPAPTPSTAETPAPATERKRNRAISGETSSLLSAGYKYSPPKPVEPAVDEDELVDKRDIDKPRNEIIRLPKYMVEGVRPPVFAERNLYTTKDFSTVLMQRYLGKEGLNKYQLGKTGQAYAAQMYWDDERLKNMMEGERQVSLYRVAGDEEKAAKAEEQNRSMFLRTNDAQSAEMSKAMGQRY
jgi:hypothetical protein